MGFWGKAGAVGKWSYDLLIKTSDKIKEIQEETSQKSDAELLDIVENKKGKLLPFAIKELKSRGYSSEKLKELMS